jgi:hypothetical protein
MCLISPKLLGIEKMGYVMTYPIVRMDYHLISVVMNYMQAQENKNPRFLKPIKMTSGNTSDCGDDNRRFSSDQAEGNQDNKNSDITTDSTKRASICPRNSHRMQDPKNLIKKSKLLDQNKKVFRNKIKPRIKSVTKKSKIRVGVTKEKDKNKSSLNIKETLNYSIIDESFMSKKILGTNSQIKGSRAYLSSNKKNESTKTSDAVHFHDGYKKRINAFSDQNLQNVFKFNDYNEGNGASGIRTGPIS